MAGFVHCAARHNIVVFNSGDSTPNAILTQTFATVVGTDYSVSFIYGGSAGQSVAFAASNLGGTTLGSLSATSNGTFSASSLFSFNFRATGTSSTLTIDDTATSTVSSDGALDNVSVSAVPEPTSLALLGAGLAGLGWVRRRKHA